MDVTIQYPSEAVAIYMRRATADLFELDYKKNYVDEHTGRPKY